ncbi:MAG: hypothetical protein MZV63_27275 [Marinilabiliales bacterium]|nr:hypothetical protein [Marinilabiliales bacterium]
MPAPGLHPRSTSTARSIGGATMHQDVGSAGDVGRFTGAGIQGDNRQTVSADRTRHLLTIPSATRM